MRPISRQSVRSTADRTKAIADFTATSTGQEALLKAGDGDFAAADQIAKATGTNRLDVLAFIRDGAEEKVWAMGAGSILGADGLPFSAPSTPLKPGATVAHLSGFRGFVDSRGNSLPLNVLTGKKPAPSQHEISHSTQLINSLPLGDQHAHEIGSAPTTRVGESIQGLLTLPVDEMKTFLAGMRKEATAITNGGRDPFIVRSLDASGRVASSAVVASPNADTGFRELAEGAQANFRKASTVGSGFDADKLIQSGIALLEQAMRMASHQQTPSAKSFVEISKSAIETVHRSPFEAAQALEPLNVGILNRIVSATTTIIAEQTSKSPSPFTVLSAESAKMDLTNAVLRLRNATSLAKPNDRKWNQVAGQINGAMEFFVRYKSVLGTHAGKMDGAGVAEVAQRRVSNLQNNLGYQELRADLDTDRFSRRFDKDHQEGMLSPSHLAEAARAFSSAMAGSGVDAFMTYALTKRETVPSGKDVEEAGVEAPLYAKQAEIFVDAFFGTNDDAKAMQTGMNGIDHGGRESPERAPMLFIRGHGKRVVHNALALQDVVKNAPPALKQLIQTAIGNDALMGAWQTVNSKALDPTTWKASAKGQALNVADTAVLQQQLGALGRTSPMDWKVMAGPLSMEDMSRVNRAVLDAMRTHAAMTGGTVDIPQLGATMHTGEQIKSCPPDVLLDQVAQSLAMGADRLGHGVILGTPMHSLYSPGPGGKLWPTMLSASKRLAPENAVFAKSRSEVDALENTRASLLQKVIDDGVVIEVNMTSNLVINDQTPEEHCINVFARKMHEGLRFSVNTDDETILATSIQKELSLVHDHLHLDVVDTSRLILESFRSRLGGKPLEHKASLAAQFVPHLAKALFSGSDDVVKARIDELSRATGVPAGAHADPQAQLALIVDKVLS